MTEGTDLLVGAWRLLDPEEREQAFGEIAKLRLAEQAGEDNETQRMINAIVRAAEHLELNDFPATDYTRARRELAEGDGEEMPSSGQIIRFFGSWRLAKEALALSETTSARRIEARFRGRKLGKVWRYNEEALEQAIKACAKHLGHCPQVAEFDWWRQRELELAQARGDETLHLPSATPYRRRWGSWEAALLHFGFTPDEVAERLERHSSSGF